MKEHVITFLAALVGGACTLLGSWFVNRHAEKMRHKEDLRRKVSFLKSIYSELEELIQRHQDTIGNRLAKLEANEPLAVFQQIGDGYFVVFDSQAAMLGEIENDELRNSIIKLYVKIKGFCDSIRFNNQLLAEIQKFSRIDPKEIIMATAYHDRLVAFGQVIRSNQQEILKLWDELKNQISEYNSNFESGPPTTPLRAAARFLMTRRKIVVFTFGGALVFGIAWLSRDFFKIDSCLDSGGCWDEVDRVCRNNEPNAQALCDRRR